MTIQDFHLRLATANDDLTVALRRVQDASPEQFGDDRDSASPILLPWD